MSQFFFKYQGTGNDFILIDDRQGDFPKNDSSLIKRLCDRKFGIGSDGLVLLQNDENADFYVDFINPDGSRSFCGNGSRCAVAFASLLGLFNGACRFNAIDGEHHARIDADMVELQMSWSGKIEKQGEDKLLDTGSPHFITMVDNVDEVDVFAQGKSIRYSDDFKEQGVNVNFVQLLNESSIRMRTYERGVEDETLSCGTGITAAAISVREMTQSSVDEISVSTRGGELKVQFEENGTVWLKGPALKVFSGEVAL